ncbi:MAG: hypothetical protein A2268_00990 [Candidatus Raymondbacteria bacterium RifOxyA12_full_50_37]|uniref:Uncharacterized protein n=1 Tax=Candidatus Raymondbacteria bacterium RIFOXYD12_FULL_49_13 TaxID=1817890 RepID=A0A1F7FFM7_UNCRA|nr:MAG: hypothetical protein A2268_00990 [Candidatus Raymondbacteria bacterium RifOxyA12_full_50_37]OGJ86378.1 MAG: hypothetical protein A2248_13955 [Candidatus Raymondbacteria bacterium RIFOXYA2_FULL_49_16]OGJ95548.1 MAG: hypothetical protein A2453_12730 [Candidatus Raymondbacteria bacterium RIFOXYC2_FULL_50_21]OGJ99445.1 MAG: hypothetical protein A2487_07485 [Candidatus Raymondbacteria bacterium RifOxyC12_full_50_8]OGK04529.1 MAG: hypothetical protein A2350_18040 [Candidatus Raymondbacteria b
MENTRKESLSQKKRDHISCVLKKHSYYLKRSESDSNLTAFINTTYGSTKYYSLLLSGQSNWTFETALTFAKNLDDFCNKNEEIRAIKPIKQEFEMMVRTAIYIDEDVWEEPYAIGKHPEIRKILLHQARNADVSKELLAQVYSSPYSIIEKLFFRFLFSHVLKYYQIFVGKEFGDPVFDNVTSTDCGLFLLFLNDPGEYHGILSPKTQTGDMAYEEFLKWITHTTKMKGIEKTASLISPPRFKIDLDKLTMDYSTDVRQVDFDKRWDFYTSTEINKRHISKDNFDSGPDNLGNMQ